MKISSDLRNAPRILIRAPNWVGDAIMATPTIRAVRRAFPAAQVTVLAKPWVIPVFRHNPAIDDVVTYDAGGRHGGALGLLRLARQLRAESFSMTILLQNAFEAALLTALAGIPIRIGYTTDGREALLTHRMRNWKPRKKGHLIDYYLGLVADLGAPADRRDLEIFLRPDERRDARERLRALGIDGDRPLIGINPGATAGTAKRWPAERFAALCRRFIDTDRAVCLLFGSGSEASVGEGIARTVGPGCVNLCGKTDLRAAMALIAACDLFITNDSGLMHVAAAFDIPQVAIIGPTDPVATGPSNRRSRIVTSPVACPLKPCLKPDCPLGDHRCMAAIGVDAVYDMAQTLRTWKMGRV